MINGFDWIIFNQFQTNNSIFSVKLMNFIITIIRSIYLKYK